MNTGLARKFTSTDIEQALTGFHNSPFNPRRWFVVPNISWGWGFTYEADLIAVNQSDRVVEIEIKVSRSDIKADVKKRKWGNLKAIPEDPTCQPIEGLPPVSRYQKLDGRVWKFYYAVPMALIPDVEALEGGFALAGIIGIKDDLTSEIVRKAKPIAEARKATEGELAKLGHLAAMRYWDQKEVNDRLRDELANRKPVAE